MEGISRKDLDRICQLLNTHVGTEEAAKLADILDKADVIPKLYVYTYFKKVHDELKTLQGDSKRIDQDELEQLMEAKPKLQLYGITGSGVKVIAVMKILGHGFERENMFCDFDDSRFHGQVKYGKCECEDHEVGELDSPAAKLRLRPVYQSDEDAEKLLDEVEWWCEVCIDNSDWDGSSVSCDMDDDP